MLGSSPGKRASITTPLISMIVPLLLSSAMSSSRSVVVLSVRPRARRSGERVRAGDDLEDLLGDGRLAGAVHRQGQVVDQAAGVVGGVAHRGAAGGQLGGRALQQRAEDGGV